MIAIYVDHTVQPDDLLRHHSKLACTLQRSIWAIFAYCIEKFIYLHERFEDKPPTPCSRKEKRRSERCFDSIDSHHQTLAAEQLVQ